MKYFRERNNLNADYSGYQEASDSLSKKLDTVCQRYLAHGSIGAGQEDYWVPHRALEHELVLHLEKKDIEQIMLYEDRYDKVFEAVEIYLAVAKEHASKRFYDEILPDMQRAFVLSGSVYYVDQDGLVKLHIDEKLAKDLKETQNLLSGQEKSYKTFFDAVGNLMARKDKPKNIVKDIFIAFENYLKENTKKKDFGKAIDYLQKEKIITATQKILLDKIYAYRSDASAVAHAGNSKEPDELDALWFLDTVIAQLKLLDRRVKKQKK